MARDYHGEIAFSLGRTPPTPTPAHCHQDAPPSSPLYLPNRLIGQLEGATHRSNVQNTPTMYTHTLSCSGTMGPSGGPSTFLGGGAPPLGTLTKDEVASWSHTRHLQALYEYELLDPEVADADTDSLRARLLAKLRTQAAAFTALAQQPPRDNIDAIALRGVRLPSSGTPIVQVGTSHEGLASPATPRIRQHPVTDDSDADLATVPFGYGPYARPKHQVDPSNGRNLEVAFAAVEDSPPREDLFAALDHDDMRQENAASVHARDNWAALPPSTMVFGGPRDDLDALS